MEIMKELLSDPTLIVLVATYAETPGNGPEERVRQRYRSFRVQLDARRFVLPLVGVQGSGKSTFLNALVFGRPVLPVDADETTSVPVEAVYAETPTGDARVLFDDGHEERVPATEEGIGEFVHQANNPGNEKRVTRVIVETDHPVLRSGLVLVDLPGLGSLTLANQETTLRYLDEAVGIIFMLRTVPPLTRSDSIFVVAQWARLRNAYFVQNRWTDERDDEADDGRQTNVRVLTDLAKRHRIPMEGEPQISVVNAYDALKARLTHDDALVSQSGLAAFTSRVEDLGQRWPRLVRAAVRNALLADLALSRDQLQRQRHDLQSDRAEVEAQVKATDEEFRQYISRLETREREALEFLAQLSRDRSTAMATWGQKARQELRNQMRTKLRAGIVDGPRLERALNDEQSDYYDEAFEATQEAILVAQDDIRERFKDLPQWKATRGDPFHTVNKEEKTKFESALPLLGGIAVGAVAGYGGGLAGAELGAAIGTAFGPGVGTVIGYAVGGLLGFFIGEFAGRKAKKAATRLRANAVESEVFAAIERFTKSAADQLSSEVEKFCTEMKRTIAGWKQEQRRAYEEEQRARRRTMSETLEERAARLRRLQEDEARLEKYQQRLATEVDDDVSDSVGVDRIHTTAA